MSRKRVLLATRNPHKLVEICELLAGLPISILSPDELGIEEDPAEDEIECWDSFAANALAKAAWFRAHSGLAVLADDSGICVDALGGKPGVHSRRFAPAELIGEDGQHAANNRLLLHLLEGRADSERGAHFRCALALLDGGLSVVANGRVDGTIATEERGSGGFGYDPLFIVPEYDRTFGQLSADVKAELSHRARAVLAMRSWLA